MLRKTGAGWVTQQKYQDRGIVYLQNFDIDGTDLKPNHQKALRELVLPQLEQGCSLTLVGMTDRLGSYQYNKRLSTERIHSVRCFLERMAKKAFRVDQLLASSEDRATTAGMRDNTRGDAFRAVAAVLWPSPQPRKIDPKSIKVPPTPGVPVFTDWGWSVDLAAGLTDLVGAFTSIVFVELLGGFFAVVGPILSGIVALAEADRNARFNGFCEGVWLGMQLLAKQYSDPKLDRLPLDEWPHLKQPTIPTRRGDLVHHRFGKLVHEGRNEGARYVYEYVRQMERKPVAVTLRGVRQKRRIGGRLMLRALYVKKGDKVADWMKSQVDDELKKRGIGPWPLGGPKKR